MMVGLREPMSLVRAGVRVLVEDQLVDRAAALTYFALLAIFPAMIVLVAVLGVAVRSDRIADVVVAMLADLLPAGAEDVGLALRVGLEARAQAGAFIGVGLLTSVWAVSGFVAGFQRASAAIRGTPDSRPPWEVKLARLPLTLLLLAMLALITLALLAVGPVGDAVERALGLSGAADWTWRLLRWPALVVVLNLFFTLLQHSAGSADGRPGRRTWFSRGGLAGTALWLIGSAGFSWYVTYVATDLSTYGALGTAVVFLGWLWLGNFAMLVGLELDIRVLHRRADAVGR
ncbi:MAG: YihY/virulence factor BrkB family protein [Pseudonocardia sp.]|nr:YihY/virulence factor BrkB family protein [Pseudonocardia sp.]MBO0873218.1 YihY/virulence factor BrkB family protein [Pseudonocardia sp.]